MRRSGFSLLEVILAVTIGLIVMAGSVAAYRQIQESAKFNRAKTMVGTIQTNIGMEKFRTGSPPTLVRLQANEDVTSKPFWPETNIGTFPDDPIMGEDTIATFDSTLDAVELVPGDASNQYDNPIFLQAGRGHGGWLYDTSTGAFRIDLSNRDYVEHRPSKW